MPLAKQVILFVIDGLHPDVLQQTSTSQIDQAVNISDTAPTIAYLLGLPTPAEWSGRIVTEVLAS